MGWTCWAYRHAVVQKVGKFPLGPFLPMVHWDGMDSGDTDMQWFRYGKFPLVSLPSHGTLVMRMDSGDTDMQWFRLGSSHSVPSFPWYIGMGWTVGIQACSSGNYATPSLRKLECEWDRSHYHSVLIMVQCNGTPKYYWTSVGNAGHVWKVGK